jgi:hypothetical protein
MSLPILKIKDENGIWHDIPALIGPKGETPILGVDYWTEADKQYIINEVLAALPIAEESEF